MDSGAVMDSIDLKVGEMLKDVRVDYSPALSKLVDDTVSAVKQSIDQIPDSLSVTADEAPGFIRDIRAAREKVQFKFRKPERIEIGGSYSIKSIAKPEISADLMVRIPKECFYEKDYLDHRYHGKRFLYLCIIKKYLKSCSSVEKVEWSTLQNEARKPILIVYPVQQLVDAPGLFFRIIPAVKNLFSPSVLRLDRKNLRSLKHDGVLLPTPRYNCSILEDMSIEDNAELLKEVFSGRKELEDTLLLLKVWVRQRSSIYLHDCLNGFLLAVILSYLATHDKINNSMKPMEIFRITLRFIAQSKLWSRGLYLQKDGVSKEERVLIKNLYPVVIHDAHTNLAFRMSTSGFLELQEEASKTLDSLNSSGDSAFEDIFLTKIDIPAKFDHCVRLSLKGVTEVHAAGFCFDIECWRSYEQKVESVLHQGLGDRAKLIRVMWRNIPPHCCIEQGFSALQDEAPLLIGVLVSSAEKASRIVDVGPAADNKEEALKFRKFWGEKAELRRFKDGTIAESTIWECDQCARHLILKRIVEFLLFRHLSLSKTNLVHVVDQLDFSLLQGVTDPMSFLPSLQEAFDILSARLRKINDLPLSISSVQDLDPALRFTSVFPPEPHPLANMKRARLHKLTPSYIQPVDIMIQFEGSGLWPQDNVAIEKTKFSFLLKVGESLQRSWGMTCVASEDDVHVFLSGFAFRLQIMHQTGLNLVKKKSGQVKIKQVCSADERLFYRSQHASMIKGFHGRFPTYGPVVRLAKRWVSSHLFSACLEEEAVELLVAHLFVKPFPFSPPLSRITGFLRFLRLLSEYDWTYSALPVDINDDMSPNERKEINENFMSTRKNSEDDQQTFSPAMFLATSYDKSSEAWTSLSPNSLELKRLAAYARSTANLLTRLILQNQADSYQWECLFRTPLNNYDAVVLLHGDRLAYPQRLLFPSQLIQGRLVAQGKPSKAVRPFLSLQDLKGPLPVLKDKLMVGLNPLRSYVTDLEKEFGVLKVWYDSVGGDAIGLTWDRSLKKRDREATDEKLDDPIKILKSVGEAGKGLVKKVHLLKAPRIAHL